MGWQAAVNDLIRQATSWALSAGFEVTVEPHSELAEVSVLTLEEGKRRIHVEPSVYAAERLPTAIDIYAFPSLVRVRLRGPDEAGAWEIFTSDNIPLRRAWSKNTFLELCADLAGDA